MRAAKNIKVFLILDGLMQRVSA